MAQKIFWQEPDDTEIDKVYIYKSATLYGSYSELINIDATSDTQPKSSSNSWVIDYIDTIGNRTDWYKIRFYDTDTTTFSDYSDPVTSEELVRLCTTDDVKVILDTVGRWTDDEIFDTITETDDLIYIESGNPLQAIWSPIGKIDATEQDTYYVGEEDIYRVDRVFYGTTTMVELFLDDGFKVNNRYGMLRILPVASSGVTLDSDKDIEIHYVPRIYHKLSLYRTCKRLLEKIDFLSSGTASKELDIIDMRLNAVETLLQHRIGVQLSSTVKMYDKVYGVNRKRIEQSHRRNRYVGSTGW